MQALVCASNAGGWMLRAYNDRAVVAQVWCSHGWVGGVCAALVEDTVTVSGTLSRPGEHVKMFVIDGPETRCAEWVFRAVLDHFGGLQTACAPPLHFAWRPAERDFTVLPVALAAASLSIAMYREIRRSPGSWLVHCAPPLNVVLMKIGPYHLEAELATTRFIFPHGGVFNARSHPQWSQIPATSRVIHQLFTSIHRFALALPPPRW